MGKCRNGEKLGKHERSLALMPRAALFVFNLRVFAPSLLHIPQHCTLPFTLVIHRLSYS